AWEDGTQPEDIRQVCLSVARCFDPAIHEKAIEPLRIGPTPGASDSPTSRRMDFARGAGAAHRVRGRMAGRTRAADGCAGDLPGRLARKRHWPAGARQPVEVPAHEYLRSVAAAVDRSRPVPARTDRAGSTSTDARGITKAAAQSVPTTRTCQWSTPMT